MRLYVKTLTNKTIEINVSEDAGIRHVKWEIEREEGVPSVAQSYIYAGKSLEYQRLLSDYRIVEDSQLHLVFFYSRVKDNIKVVKSGEKINLCI